MNIPPSIRARRSLRALVLAGFGLVAFARLHGQGCVAVKQMGDISCDLTGIADHHEASKWAVNFNYQYFRSHRHFVGHDEQQHRAEARSEVVNLVNQLTTTISYQKDPRTAFTLNVPYFHAVRSSLYEHDRVNRYKTRSNGIGDISLGVTRWIYSPMSEKRTNFAFGIGIDVPTGDSNVKDTFQRPGGPEIRNVDQSIQPGDGGWGIPITVQGYHRLGENTALYGTGFYLVTPQEKSGTYRSNDPVTGRFSIADQYQLRGGITHVVSRQHGLSASLGLRWEGVPALDIIGGDAGFRRPGYTVSVEPGISYMTARDSFSLSVPVAISRSRQKSYADRLTGGHGDAAFADFLINFSYARHW